MLRRHRLTLCRAHMRTVGSRNVSLNRPAPHPLPKQDQLEFEELLRKAHTPATPDLDVHPDSLAPITPEFEGDVNPKTGERGGPKREPVRQWGPDSDGDWSFKGRVSDF